MILNLSKVDRRTWLGKAVRWPLTLIPPQARLPVMQGALRGKRWIVGSSNHGCWLGSYERDHQVLLENRLRKGDIFFDVGAHAGFYTLLGSLLVGSSGRVIAFEPIPENLAYLRQHLKINSIQNAEIVEAAVADRKGFKRIARGPSSSMWYFDARGELNVPTVTLDEMVFDAELPPPSFIKMDIEGAECLALTGAARTLYEYRPALMLSTHGPETHRSCRSLLSSAGYRLSPIGTASIRECRELLAIHRDTA